MLRRTTGGHLFAPGRSAWRGPGSQEGERAMGERADVVHNRVAGRFEIRVGDEVAVLDYALSERRIVFVHTGVPSTLEGRGYGSQLARAGLDYARNEGLGVVAQCPFVRSYIERHDQYRPLIE